MLIFIKIYKNDPYMLIQIKDNVNDMPESILNKIFNLYFTTKEDHEGTGIGLFLILC
jgi:signal transduction histidine kinase